MRTNKAMLAAIGAAVVGMGAMAAQAQLVAGNNYFLGTFGGHNYYFRFNRDLWTNSAAYAAAFQPGNSYLATINSAAEQAFLNSVLNTPPYAVTEFPVYWIGLNGLNDPTGALGAAGFQTTIDGSTQTYFNFAGDAPVNLATHRYVSANWNINGVWQNLPDNGLGSGKFSVIEVDPLLPAPGAAALLGLGGLMAARRRR